MGMLFDIGILDAEQVHERLEPQYQKISESIQSGQNAYEHLIQVAPEQCKSFTPTTRANIVHNNMIEHAKRVFSEVEDVVCYSMSKIFTVDFFGKIRLRFKKLDSSLRPANISTVQQQDFSRQTLFGDDSTKITAGYRLDSAGVSIRDMHLVCWYND